MLAEDAIGPGAPEVPTGETGVLWVKGDSVSLGYWLDRDKSWRTFHGHWCRTGDLFITVQVEPHETFHRQGDDFHVMVPIGVHEAALGAKIDVPAPDGTARLRIPPGTQTGQRFHVRGRGAPSPRTGERGDLVVEVRIVLPRMLDERSKELLREFGKMNEIDRTTKVDGRAAASDR